MKKEVRDMLETMYGVLNRKFNDSVKAWDSLVEFLAADNCAPLLYQLDHKFEWLFEDSRLAEELMKTYDVQLLRSDYYDHLGEMYLEKIVSTTEAARKGLFLTPMNVAETMAAMTVGESKEPLKILDPAVGTGRLLMAAHKRAPNSMLFGVDLDLRALRIAFTNFAIHNISAYLLNADSLLHEIDISKEEGRRNWRYANRWYSCTDKLNPASKESAERFKDCGQKRAQMNLFTK